MKTKKVGSAGRFGARYGRSVKLKLSKVEKLYKRKHICPKCKKEKVKRVASGIWECSRCGNRFAGGAYTPFLKTERTSEEEE